MCRTGTPEKFRQNDRIGIVRFMRHTCGTASRITHMLQKVQVTKNSMPHMIVPLYTHENILDWVVLCFHL